MSFKYEPTEEQRAIIAYNPLPGEILKILAFAGTGKTTTLINYAKARPDKSFLYLAFNKNVQLEATKKFTNNVSCKTAHALAFANKGFRYRGNIVPGIRPYQIVSLLDIKSDKNQYKIASLVLNTFNKYLMSDEKDVGRNNISMDFYEVNHESFRNASELISMVKRVKDHIKDGGLLTGIPHDFYLKEYQLSDPVLKYDYIFLDEAQDINPVIADIVLQQVKRNNPPAIIMVGDNHQQIYSFRGARGILSKTRASKTMFLTQSFRFDDSIARLASLLLKHFKNETKTLKGTSFEVKPPWNEKQYTLISRTNAVLFDHAVNLIKNNKIGFLGPIEGYRFHLMKDISNLMHGKGKIQDNFIRNFNSYEEIKNYASHANDIEITSMCTVVEKYRENISELIQEILEKHFPCKESEITLTTAHKAKGLEWDNVLMSHDFISLVKNDQILTLGTKYQDEINLLYVAMTRAIYNLKVKSTNSLNKFAKIYFKNKYT